MRTWLRQSVLLVFVCLSGVSAFAQTKYGISWDNTPDLGDLDDYVSIVEEVSRSGDQSVVTLFYIAFSQAERKGNLREIGLTKYQWALLRGILSLGGEQSQRTARIIVDAYFSKANKDYTRNLLYDREFSDVVISFVEEMGAVANDETGKWALQIFNNTTYPFLKDRAFTRMPNRVRQAAYYCYLGACLNKVERSDDKIAMLIGDLRTFGCEANNWLILKAFLDGNIDDSVIQDSARVAHLRRIGEPALPQLMTAWKVLMGSERKTDGDAIHQYALARVVNLILDTMEAKPFDPLPLGPAAMSKDELRRNEDEWDAEFRKQSNKGGKP
jgi:hypothetical protein